MDSVEDTVVTIPSGTMNIRINYNLSWAPVSTGTHGLLIWVIMLM
ncbi:hypothetical protein [Methanobacterium aggregans]|nr:hypothetical protein [Methanobacterium aggregans]MBP2045760.1 hypothetical protein [Methanobacterium aggregans]